MKPYYIDGGGIPCDIRKSYPRIVTSEEAVELLNQLTNDLEAAQMKEKELQIELGAQDLAQRFLEKENAILNRMVELVDKVITTCGYKLDDFRAEAESAFHPEAEKPDPRMLPIEMPLSDEAIVKALKEGEKERDAFEKSQSCKGGYNLRYK